MIPVPMPLSPCQEIDDLLSEYLDGELDARGAARVEVHLATCPPCARFAAELAATVSALHHLGHAAGAGTEGGSRAGQAHH